VHQDVPSGQVSGSMGDVLPPSVRVGRATHRPFVPGLMQPLPMAAKKNSYGFGTNRRR